MFSHAAPASVKDLAASLLVRGLIKDEDVLLMSLGVVRLTAEARSSPLKRGTYLHIAVLLL